MQSLRRKTDLREACMTRVPLEPTECFVTVKVRHVTMGKQERRFPSSSAMSSVKNRKTSPLVMLLHCPYIQAIQLWTEPWSTWFFQTKDPLWLIVKFSSEVLDGLITDDTLEDMFPVLEQNEESSKPALANRYSNTMGNDNLYVQAV